MKKLTPTPVEWLFEQLLNINYNPLENGGYDIAKNKIFDQANAMFNEQILIAHMNGQAEHDSGAYSQEVKGRAEQYYNETYNNYKP
jgi:hypothetical protein